MMYKTARLANWLKVRPSELWNLRSKIEDEVEEGEIDSYLLDFDFAVMEFWEFLTMMREDKRKKRIPASAKLGDNQYWAPKYTDEEILDKIFLKFEKEHLISATMSDGDIMDILDEWDLEEE